MSYSAAPTLSGLLNVHPTPYGHIAPPSPSVTDFHTRWIERSGNSKHVAYLRLNVKSIGETLSENVSRLFQSMIEGGIENGVTQNKICGPVSDLHLHYSSSCLKELGGDEALLGECSCSILDRNRNPARYLYENYVIRKVVEMAQVGEDTVNFTVAFSENELPELVLFVRLFERLKDLPSIKKIRVNIIHPRFSRTFFMVDEMVDEADMHLPIPQAVEQSRLRRFRTVEQIRDDLTSNEIIAARSGSIDTEAENAILALKQELEDAKKFKIKNTVPPGNGYGFSSDLASNPLNKGILANFGSLSDFLNYVRGALPPHLTFKVRLFSSQDDYMEMTKVQPQKFSCDLLIGSGNRFDIETVRDLARKSLTNKGCGVVLTKAGNDAAYLVSYDNFQKAYSI